MSAELTAQELIADWITEDASDLPDDTPITIKIGNRSIILDKLGNLRAALLPAQPEPDAGRVEDWQPMDTAPMDGTTIYRRVVQPYRYLPYKPNSQQAKRGERGRWQMMNEYGGWDNCPTPMGSEWSRNWMPPSPPREEIEHQGVVAVGVKG